MSGSDKDLYSGLIRLHVLHHAAERPIYGSWMIEELHEHGYEISPGTLYPTPRAKCEGYSENCLRAIQRSETEEHDSFCAGRER